MTVTQGEIERGLSAVGLGKGSHVLVHASYKAFGGVEGGPAMVVGALVETASTVMMPASTWERTAVWDASGLYEGNAYAPEPPPRANPAPFSYDTPIDKEIGIIPEIFRQVYPVCRSSHPLQSFIAYGDLAESIAGDGQDISAGAPIGRLMDAGGVLLLAGVTHTASTAVHLAEERAGRTLFVRHARTDLGVLAVSCGGCGEAFDELQSSVGLMERNAVVGNATLRCYDLRLYVEAVGALIEKDPYALLCDCDRCRAHKERVPA